MFNRYVLENDMIKIWRALQWIIINTAVAIVAYYGYIQDIGWCQNIVAFMVWLGLAVMWCALIMKKVDNDKFKKSFHGRSVPSWTTISYDFAFAILLAAYAHFVLAAVMILTTVVTESVYDEEK